MKVNISDLAGKINKGVGIAASITVGLAITLTAVVHIKECLKELKVHKKPRIKNVVIITDSCDSEKTYEKTSLPETSEDDGEEKEE